MLELHQDKLTEIGRELYRRIMDLMGDGNGEQRAQRMYERELIHAYHLIRDLFHERSRSRPRCNRRGVIKRDIKPETFFSRAALRS